MKKVVIILIVSCFGFGNCSEVIADNTYYIYFNSDYEGGYDFLQKEYNEPQCALDDYGYFLDHEWIYVKKSKTYKVYKCETCKCYKYLYSPNKKVKKGNVKKEKAKAKKVVKKFFKYAKKYNADKLTSCFYDEFYDVLEDYPTNKKYKSIFRKINKKLKWKIKSVTKKGNTFKVKVKVKMPSLKQQIYKAAYNSLVYYSNLHPEDYGWWGAYSLDAIDNDIIRAMKNNINNVRIKKKTVVFKVKKTKEGYYIKKKNRTLLDLPTAEWSSAYSKADKKWINAD